ncbi:MAG TPA: DUF899 family protein [Chthonomonadales bacterium]|nr:DUF899 family protein [Chthonomonadales bacterium]
MTEPERRQAVAEEMACLHSQIRTLRSRLAELRKEYAGERMESYVFQDVNGDVTLDDLFGGKPDLIVVHNMGECCPYCSLWADGFSAFAPHLEQRASFVVVSPDDPSTQQAIAKRRGWRFRMVSSRDNNFMKDTGYLQENGSRLPGASAFHKDEGGIIRRVSTATFGPLDEFCSIWHLLDMLQDGANGWEPGA